MPYTLELTRVGGATHIIEAEMQEVLRSVGGRLIEAPQSGYSGYVLMDENKRIIDRMSIPQLVGAFTSVPAPAFCERLMSKAERVFVLAPSAINYGPWIQVNKPSLRKLLQKETNAVKVYLVENQDGVYIQRIEA